MKNIRLAKIKIPYFRQNMLFNSDIQPLIVSSNVVQILFITIIVLRNLELICSLHLKGCPRRVMVKAMDCGIVVSEFVLQSRYYVPFWAITLGKGMNPLILPAMG